MLDRKAYLREYYRRNRAKYIERAKQWNARWCALHGPQKSRSPTPETRATLKLRRDQNRAFFLEKLGGKCVDCGYSAHSSALQFDHVIPAEKRQKIAALMTIKNRERIWPEVKKCVLRCANCHAIKTVTNGESGRRRPKV